MTMEEVGNLAVALGNPKLNLKGDAYLCDCPVCHDPNIRLVLELKEGSLKVNCWNGCLEPDIHEAIKAEGLLDPPEAAEAEVVAQVIPEVVPEVSKPRLSIVSKGNGGKTGGGKGNGTPATRGKSVIASVSPVGEDTGETTPPQPEVPVREKLALASIKCLGFLERDYFYTSTSNKQLVRISVSSHGPSALLNLMPLDYWWDNFPGKNNPAWDKATSWLMEECRKRGIFNAKRIRGAGAWKDGDQLVIHLGDRLWIDQRELDLSQFNSRNTYRLGPDYPAPPAPADIATSEECEALIQACNACQWDKPSSGLLLAGHLALLRISGALPWRPHGWVTGPAGSGKSTLMNTVVAAMGGQWACTPQANTTEAGIRQELEVDSRPVLFDEIEAEDTRARGRVKGIIELARQSSSDSEGRIYKGTADGRGTDYKVNSMFLLASIGVSLSQEADLTRFIVYELKRPLPGSDSAQFLERLSVVGEELGNRIFGRMIRQWKVLLKNYALLQRVIAARSTHRHGQQYGMLLAGYVALKTDGVIDMVDAERLVDGIELGERIGESTESSAETSCLQHLLASRVRVVRRHGEGENTWSVQALLDEARLSGTICLEAYGIKWLGDCFVVANQHPELKRIFADTPWEKNWKRTFLRIPGAKPARQRFNTTTGNALHCVSMPLAALRSEKPDTLPDGIENPGIQ